jgi:hypothetical protein
LSSLIGTAVAFSSSALAADADDSSGYSPEQPARVAHATKVQKHALFIFGF